MPAPIPSPSLSGQTLVTVVKVTGNDPCHTRNFSWIDLGYSGNSHCPTPPSPYPGQTFVLVATVTGCNPSSKPGSKQRKTTIQYSSELDDNKRIQFDIYSLITYTYKVLCTGTHILTLYNISHYRTKNIYTAVVLGHININAITGNQERCKL